MHRMRQMNTKERVGATPSPDWKLGLIHLI